MITTQTEEYEDLEKNCKSLACKLSAHSYVVKHGREFWRKADMTGQLHASPKACHNKKYANQSVYTPTTGNYNLNWEPALQLSTVRVFFT